MGDRRDALRIVIVDDNASILHMLRVAAGIVGNVEIVGEATDGSAAIEVCTEQRPDGVVLDVEMPVLDGVSAIGAILEAVPSTTIVMFSSDETREAAARAAGAHAYFTKGDTSPMTVLDGLAALRSV